MLDPFKWGVYTFAGECNMGKMKKIAVLVRDKKAEALRMALGLTVLENDVSVFIMDEPFEPEDEKASMSLQGLRDMGAKIYTNCLETPFESMSTEEIALAITEFDVIIPY
jgi:hypothetical protein